MRLAALVAGAFLYGCFHPAVASTSQLDVAIALTDTSISLASDASGTGMTVWGSFRLPTIDPLQQRIDSFSATISFDIGGAIWRPGRANEEIEGSVAWNMAIGYTPASVTGVLSGGASTEGWTSAIGIGSYADINASALPSGSIPYAELLYAGGSLDAGGYVPLLAQINVSAGGTLAYGPPPYYPSRIVFAANVFIVASYTTTDLSLLTSDQDHSLQSVPTQDIFYGEYLVEGATQLPSSIASQLPAYLPLPVPEPGSGVLMMLGLCAAGAGAWRRRQRGSPGADVRSMR